MSEEGPNVLLSKGIYQFLAPVVNECDDRVQAVFKV